MIEFFEEINLTAEQVQVIAQGLSEVAKIDGIHESERIMIEEFFKACQQDAPGSLKDLSPFNIQHAKTVLPDDKTKSVFLKTLILLCYADGAYSSGEAEAIQRYARDLGVSEAHLENLHEAVKDYLMSQISHLVNLEALTDIGNELDILKHRTS